jgi:hypothetical protein
VRIIIVLLAAVITASCQKCGSGANKNNNRSVYPSPTATITPGGEQTPTPSPSPTLTPTPTPSPTPTPDNRGQVNVSRSSASASLVKTIAWVQRRNLSDLLYLTERRPSLDVVNRDIVSTNSFGEVKLNIRDCSNAYLFHNTRLVNSPCSRAERRFGGLGCLVGGLMRVFNGQGCRSKIRLVRTDSAEIILEGTYASLYYFPAERLTLLQLRDEPWRNEQGQVPKAVFRPIIDPGDRRHPPVFAPKSEEFMLGPGEGVMSQPGVFKGQDIAGVPQRTKLPLDKFNPVINLLGQNRNAQRAVDVAKDDGVPVTALEENPGLEVVLQDNRLEFDLIPLGKSLTEGFTIRSLGLKPLRINDLTFAGVNAADFRSSSDECLNRDITVTCSVKIEFKPSGAGTRTADLLVGHNAPGSPYRVTLSGGAVPAPPILLPPVNPSNPLAPFELSQIGLKVGGTALSGFGVQRKGVAQTRSFRVTNGWKAPLKVTLASVTGTGKDAFTVDNKCPEALPVSGTCDLNVTFTPADTKKYEASLSFAVQESEVPNPTPHYVTPFPLNGEGAEPVIKVEPSEVCFGSEKEVKKSEPRIRDVRELKISNVGGYPMKITDIVSNTNDFIVVNKGGCVGVDLTGKCTVTVGFFPRGSRVRAGEVTILHDAANASPAIVKVSGVGKSRNYFVRFYEWIFRRTKSTCKTDGINAAPGPKKK